MPVGICIIAHAPLASALKHCVTHIFSATGDHPCEDIEVFDVPETIDPQTALSRAQSMADRFNDCNGVIIFTDILGATPSNIAHRLLDRPYVRIVTGVNLPALITAVSHADNACLNQLVTLTEGAAHSGISSAAGTPAH